VEFARFLLQLVVVVLVCWVCGRLARMLRQPAVIGEIAGGLLLGPSAFGRWLPQAFVQLFPVGHVVGLERVSNAGLVLFLFALGLEMDLPRIATRGRALLLTTMGSLAFPFLTGTLIAFALASHFLQPGQSFVAFALFIGTAFSITALPVLGRILRDRESSGRPVRPQVAELAFACATINDGAAWILLLLALTAARASDGFTGVARTIVLLTVFICVMVWVVRPLMQRWFDRTSSVLIRLLACVALAFAGAAITDALGVHAFFGAVLAGVCAPRLRSGHAEWTRMFEARLRPVLLIALPVFFALTGLKTRITWDSASLWLTALIVVSAAGSKILAGTVMARAGGLTWSMAGEVGVLLNTRGLVELIVLNVGLRAGVLTPALFSALVMMALITTAMTVPALDVLRLQTRSS
jgi:Kef-type K+ transport system membrane component KefB